MQKDTLDLLAPLPSTAFTAQLLSGMPPELASRLDARLIFAIQQGVETWDGIERRRGRHLRLRLPLGTWRLSITRESGPPLRDIVRHRPGKVAGASLAAGLVLALALGVFPA